MTDFGYPLVLYFLGKTLVLFGLLVFRGGSNRFARDDHADFFYTGDPVIVAYGADYLRIVGDIFF